LLRLKKINLEVPYTPSIVFKTISCWENQASLTAFGKGGRNRVKSRPRLTEGYLKRVRTVDQCDQIIDGFLVLFAQLKKKFAVLHRVNEKQLIRSSSF